MTTKQVYVTLCVLFIINTLCFSSCLNHHSVHPELQKAKKLMETAPDSALVMLDNIKSPEKLSKKEYATYCLLLTQALDKNYYTHESDSLIKIATAYYESHYDIESLASCYYIMGRVYSDMQKDLQAQQYYLKALELAISTKSVDLLVKINNSLGSLYFFQDIFEMALPLYKKALDILVGSKDSTNTSLALRNIARVYTETQQLDSAICYYQQAIKIATPQSISSLQTDLGNLYLKTEKYNEAYDYIQKAMQTCQTPYFQYHLYLTFGEYLFKTAQYDSAQHYLNQSIQSPNLYTQAGSLYFLAQIERQKSDTTSYFKHWDRYEQLRDSINNASHFENIRMVQSMFNYQRISDEKIKFEKKATRRMTIIYQILVVSSLLLLFSFFSFKREQKKKKKMLDLKEKLYKQSQQCIEDNKKQIKMLEKDLYNGQEDLSETKKQLFETRKLMLEMENRQILLKQQTIVILEKDFKSSALYIKINKAEDCLTVSEWLELALLIDATYSNFTKRLFELSQRISIEELHICYLVKIGIPVKKIAALMNLSYSGVSHCRRRLYKKLTQEPENAEKFDNFIADF